MRKFYIVMCPLLLCMAFGLQSVAQNITISGDSIATFTINKTMFREMKQAVVMAKAHDDKVHRYTGVTVANLLAKAGILLGDTAKRKSIISYIVVTAADNYKAIYSLPEIDPLFANRTILLADKEDKKLLASENGPYQMIVPAEKEHARWVRQVVSIEVVTLKQ
ncbi:hypothetical protein [Mucilaginibacter sp. PAMB04168]|uniref:hypothetical protein n=1 Tax=Mucilaginibacter sp. PAMB04168 TaxID=3138567 RepID=UPI0031F6AA7E